MSAEASEGSVRRSVGSVRSSFHRRRQFELADYLHTQMKMDLNLAHSFLRIHQTTTLAQTMDLFLTDDNGLANHYYIPPLQGLPVCRICEQPGAQHRLIDDEMVRPELAVEEEEGPLEMPNENRITCEICYIEVVEDDLVKLKGTIHNICLQCMDHYLREEISNMRVERIACPHCGVLLPPEAIRELTDTPTYNKYRLFLRNLEIQKSPNLKWCPNPKCSVVISTNSSKKTSKCPKCATQICNKCNREAHHGSSCAGAFEQQIKGWENASDIQKCKKCQGLVEKIAGCNHMTCSICRYEWCWLCGSAYSTAHFSALNPFGCPGLQDRPRDDWGKCRIILLRIGLLLLFVIAIPVLLPVAMIACGPALIGNLLWNCIYPDTCLKKMGVILLSFLLGLMANPVVWIGAIVYLLPKGIKKAVIWVRQRRQAQQRRQNFLQERLLGQQVFEEEKLMRE